MISSYPRDQVWEYLRQGWSLSKKRIKGHQYGYLQKYREPPIYLGKWSPDYGKLKKLQTEDDDIEDLDIEPIESSPPVMPSGSIQVESPRTLSAYTKGNVSDKIPTFQAIEVPELKIFPPSYMPPLPGRPPNPPVPSPPPPKEEHPETPIPGSSQSSSDPLKEFPLQKEELDETLAEKPIQSENPIPAIALVSAIPIIGGIGFVIHNWKAIDQWGKDRLKDLENWEKDLAIRWKNLFPR